MFKEILDDIKSGDVLAIIISLLCLVVASALIWLAFYFIDSSFLPETNTHAVVIGKHHSPGYFQTQVISTGNTTTTSLIWIPDSWSANIDTGSERVSCPVSELVFNMLQQNQNVIARLVSGRISGATYCNGLGSML